MDVASNATSVGAGSSLYEQLSTTPAISSTTASYVAVSIAFSIAFLTFALMFVGFSMMFYLLSNASKPGDMGCRARCRHMYCCDVDIDEIINRGNVEDADEIPAEEIPDNQQMLPNIQEQVATSPV